MTATGPTTPHRAPYKQAFRGSPSRSVLSPPAVNRPDRPGGDIAVQLPVSKASLPLDNKLLASLPRDHFDRLLPHLVTIPLPQGDVLAEAGDEGHQIYFPHSRM